MKKNREPAPRRRRPAQRLRIEGKSVGDEPGLLRASPTAPPAVMDVTCVGPDAEHTQPLEDLADVEALRKEWPLVWLNVVGLGDAALVGRIGEVFELHALALEDVLNVHQRPKCDEYDASIFVVSRLFHPDPDFVSEQVSMFVGVGFVITFQEQPADWFDPVRRRLLKPGTRLRRGTADFLAYALLDATVDGFFPLLEGYGDRLETLEDSIMAGANDSQLREIRDIKRELLAIRRTLWSMREALGVMQHSEHALIAESTAIYIRDCHDHAIQLLDIVESFRELAGSLVDIYLSAVANRNAEVGKVLTVVATIFLPLSFLAGVYGMNFNTQASPYNMPELDARWGYPGLLLFMALVAGSLIWYFGRRGWLRGAED